MTRSIGRPNCVYCKFRLGKRSRTTRICAACRVPLCFSGENDCFTKYHHRNFQSDKELIEKKYQHREKTQLVATIPTVLGKCKS